MEDSGKMESLIANCPFQFDKTPLDPAFCASEVLPFKNLQEVARYLHFFESGNTLPWLEKVSEIVPSTDYCYYHSLVNLENEYWYPKPRLDRGSMPRTIFCHDYKGGYLEDRFVNGSDQHDSYVFFNWSCVDIFIYFSHNFVTIPPPGWINAAHKNGVPILGTLITEWADGRRLWEQILTTNESAKWFADVLSLFAFIYKFDGYLLNVENPVAEELMPRMMLFIKSLKDGLKEVKTYKSYVIWYDSIIVTGQLRWQNELNYNNKPFFDITDGIFLNYSWNLENLNRSKKMAGERIFDVYVGIDIFGRNMFGGGGFNTPTALEKIREIHLSAAIFAFAWTMEVLPGDFYTNDRLFWGKLMPFLFTHGTRQLPFSTDFCRGYGMKYFENGVAIRETPWFDLSKQSLQYSYMKCQNLENEFFETGIIISIIELTNMMKYKNVILDPENSKEYDTLSVRLGSLYSEMRPAVVEYALHDAYRGGGCLKIVPKLTDTPKHISLFDCDLLLANEWFVTTVTKSETEKQVSDAEFYPIVYVVMQTWENIMHKIELRHVSAIEELPSNWIKRYPECDTSLAFTCFHVHEWKKSEDSSEGHENGIPSWDQGQGDSATPSNRPEWNNHVDSFPYLQCQPHRFPFA